MQCPPSAIAIGLSQPTHEAADDGPAQAGRSCERIWTAYAQRPKSTGQCQSGSSPVINERLLRSTLDRLYSEFNYPDSATDPIQIVRRYERPDDREVVGFCAAALAFGRVASVLQSIERLLAIVGDRPAAYVRAFDPVRQKHAFAGLVHRWIGAPDIVALLWILKQMIDRVGLDRGILSRRRRPIRSRHHGRARQLFDSGARSSTSRRRTVRRHRRHGPPTAGHDRHRGVRYFFPRPSAGSACKRLNLFLRWMVRRDALDLGLWTRVAPARLVVPLDTHVIRVGRCLRLTRYTSPGWPMARDITRTLSRLDPVDPVKYDFSLCHLGMMNACGFSRRAG